MTVSVPATITPGGDFPVANSPDIARPNGSSVEGSIAATEAAAQRLGDILPPSAGVALAPSTGDIGPLLVALLDELGFLGAGLTTGGTWAAKNLRALSGIITPMLSVGAGGSVALGQDASVVFGEGGSLRRTDGGPRLDMAGGDFDAAITDEAGYVLAGVKGGKIYMPRQVMEIGNNRVTTTHANGVQMDVGLHNYDVCVADANGNVLAGWLEGQFYGPGQSSIAADLDKADAAAKLYSRNVYARRVTTVQRPTANYNAQFVNGQSLGQGDETWPALSRTSRYNNLMLGGSVQPRNGGSVFNPVGGSATFQPLFAITIDNSNTLYPDETATPATGGARGEPVSHGWANGSKYAFEQYRLMSPDPDHRFVSVNVAVSGATIGELSKNHTEGGTESYGRYLDSITKMKAIATGEGKSFVVAGYMWIQGEHDYGAAAGHTSLNMTYATYRAKLEAHIADVQGDAIALTGQALPPPFFCYQTGASYTRDVDANGTPGLHIGMAQYDVILAHPNAWMVGPVYPYTDKGGHLDSNGSRWFGHQIAKVSHQVTVEGRDWEPVHPIRIWKGGPTTVYVAYHVPYGPLVFDDAQRSGGTVYNASDRGFRITDDGGDVTVTGEIVRDTIIKLTTSRALQGNPKLWYASAKQTGNGMVRDSDPATAIDNYVFEPERGMYATANIARFVGKPYPLWNWSVAFYLPIN
jgi:hypothetical protein